MNEAERTREQLLEELETQRQRIAVLEATDYNQTEEGLHSVVSRDLVSQMLRDLQAIGAISTGAMHRAGQSLWSSMGPQTLQRGLETFTSMGLGSLALIEADEDAGRWIFIAHGLMEVQKDTGSPTCHYTRGVLYSAVRQISGGARLADAEVACQSMADTACRFVVQVIGE